MRILLILLLLSLSYSLGFSCTTFVLKTESDLLFGRNLDWVSENGIVVVNQRDQTKESLVFPPDLPIKWTSKYGSVTFNQFGKEFPFGGINETGLVVEIMVASAEYPKHDERKAVNELQWVQYQLDNASSVDEVIANDRIIRLSRINQSLHFLVADKTGDVAVIEFIGGKMTVYRGGDLPYPVLENDSYKTSIQRFERNETCRFHTAVDHLTNYTKDKDQSAIDYSFNILEDVALDGSWSIVYDIKNRQIHFVTASKRQRKTINLASLDFSCNSETLAFDLHEKSGGQINDRFVVLNHELNTTKMMDAMMTNQILLPDLVKSSFYNYHLSVGCE